MSIADEITAPGEVEPPLFSADDLSSVLAESCPPLPSTPPKGSKEHRTVERYRVKWHVTAYIDAQSLLHGIVRDLSVKGAAVLLDKNLKPAEHIKLHIHVPPLHVSHTPHLVEVLGKVVYTVHDAEELRFRTGISFISFNTEHDTAFLAEYLDKNATLSNS